MHQVVHHVVEWRVSFKLRKCSCPLSYAYIYVCVYYIHCHQVKDYTYSMYVCTFMWTPCRNPMADVTQWCTVQYICIHTTLWLMLLNGVLYSTYVYNPMADVTQWCTVQYICIQPYGWCYSMVYCTVHMYTYNPMADVTQWCTVQYVCT